jgi:N-succinyl-L-ornithine transcarbamylase
MNYISVQNIDSLSEWVKAALKIKNKPLKNKKLGKNKTLGMLFFNPSLRTRLRILPMKDGLWNLKTEPL